MSEEKKLAVESATEIVSAWLSSPVAKIEANTTLCDCVEEAIKLLRNYYQRTNKLDPRPFDS